MLRVKEAGWRALAFASAEAFLAYPRTMAPGCVHSREGKNESVNRLMALARNLLGTPERLQFLDGDTDVFGDGSVTLISTSGHTPGHQSLLVHLEKSGFVLLSSDVAPLKENFNKSIVLLSIPTERNRSRL